MCESGLRQLRPHTGHLSKQENKLAIIQPAAKFHFAVYINDISTLRQHLKCTNAEAPNIGRDMSQVTDFMGGSDNSS